MYVRTAEPIKIEFNSKSKFKSNNSKFFTTSLTIDINSTVSCINISRDSVLFAVKMVLKNQNIKYLRSVARKKRFEFDFLQIYLWCRI